MLPFWSSKNWTDSSLSGYLFIRKIGKYILKLWANEIARKLYASLGFEETDEMDGDEIVAVLKL